MTSRAGLTMSMAAGLAVVLSLVVVAWATAAAGDSRPSSGALAKLGIETSAAQDAALEDGIVSEDEYRSAIASARACITGKGVVLAPAGDLSAEITALTAESAMPAEEVTGIVNGCLGAHLSTVSLAWASQQPRIDPGSHAFLAAFTGCLVANGIAESEMLEGGAALQDGVLAGFDEITVVADSLRAADRSAGFRVCQRQFPQVFALSEAP